jgi:hypothetical protein
MTKAMVTLFVDVPTPRDENFPDQTPRARTEGKREHIRLAVEDALSHADFSTTIGVVRLTG